MVYGANEQVCLLMTTFVIRTMVNMIPSKEIEVARDAYKQTLRDLQDNPDTRAGEDFRVTTEYRDGTPYKLLTLYTKEHHED